MNMPFQIIIVLFLVFALSRVILRFRGGQIKQGEFIFWAIIFLVAILGITLPFEATRLANFMGIGRGVDLVVYVSIAVLFYLVFRLYVMLQDIRRDMSEIVRRFALENRKKK